MNVFPLGRINITTPGTLVPLVTVNTPCSRLRIQAIPGLTGKIYLGTYNFNRATSVGLIAVLSPTAADNVLEAYDLYTAAGDNGIHLEQYLLDAAVPGEGALVTYWQG